MIEAYQDQENIIMEEVELEQMKLESIDYPEA